MPFGHSIFHFVLGLFRSCVQIHQSRLQSPNSVEELSDLRYIHRLRLVDNSSNSYAPRVVYDSRTDRTYWRKVRVPVRDFALADRDGSDEEEDLKRAQRSHQDDGHDQTNGHPSSATTHSDSSSTNSGGGGGGDSSKEASQADGSSRPRSVLKRAVTQTGEVDLSVPISAKKPTGPEVSGGQEEETQVEGIRLELGRL